MYINKTQEPQVHVICHFKAVVNHSICLRFSANDMSSLRLRDPAHRDVGGVVFSPVLTEWFEPDIL